MAKYIRFEKISGDPPTWSIVNKRGHDEIGRIAWYYQWSQYVLYDISISSIWSGGCLEDVAAFLKKLNGEK